MSKKSYRKKYAEYIFEEHGEFIENMTCMIEDCNKSSPLDIHHIIYKSEEGKHPEIHNPRNLILVDRDCHRWLEADKSRRNYLVRERNLEELFGCKLIVEDN